MNLTDYQRAAIRTAKWFPSLIGNLEHVALGLLTEPGEFATIIKRVAVYDKPMTDEMRAHALEELGDTYWYVALGCEIIATTIEACRKDIDDSGLSPLTEIKGATMALGGICGAYSALVAAMKASGETAEFMREMPEFFGIASIALDKCITMLGANPDDVRADNIAKLRLRFPEKYTDQAAEERADKGGLDARHS